MENKASLCLYPSLLFTFLSKSQIKDYLGPFRGDIEILCFRQSITINQCFFTTALQRVTFLCKSSLQTIVAVGYVFCHQQTAAQSRFHSLEARRGINCCVASADTAPEQGYSGCVSFWSHTRLTPHTHTPHTCSVRVYAHRHARRGCICTNHRAMCKISVCADTDRVLEFNVCCACVQRFARP